MERTREVHGVSVPAFFYGTAWKEERTEALTLQALQAGFLAIDTANQRKHYFEAGVGDAIAKSGIERERLFLQTKFTHGRGQDHRMPYDPAAPPAKQVEQSFASSLEHLRTDHVDSYVLHGPSLGDRINDVDWEVWRAMGELQRAGKTRLLGVSNVALIHLQELFDGDGPRPAFVQNRCYARTGWDHEVRAFCRAHEIVYQGFSLLTANVRELKTPAVARIAQRTGMTLPQIVFNFAVAVGMIPLTGSSNGEHLRQDLASFDFTLGDDEIAALERVAF
jgi:diketogulonate reductase-like aldo/keto reductase